MTIEASEPRNRARLRDDLLHIFAAAIAVVEPARVTARALDGEVDQRAPAIIGNASRVRLLAMGKAAVGMAHEAHRRLGAKIVDTLVIAPPPVPLELPFRLMLGSHPLPDAASERAGRAALEFVERAEANELVLLLLSGGASALAVAPAAGISLNDKVSLTSSLMRAGASIHELNTARKHLSDLKGGGLLRALKAEVRILSLILSDVADNDLATIGSGPASADPTTFADAIGVLKRRKLWGRTSEPVRDRLERGVAGELCETVKPDDPIATRAVNIIVGDNQLAREAAAGCAQQLGYRTECADSLSDDAERAGRALATHLIRIPDERVCLISGGEPVVIVKGNGRGGRAQHCALALAIALGESKTSSNLAVLIAGTDGIDGPTDAAGAIVTPETIARAREAGLDPQKALARHDSYTFFKSLGDLIVTGPTGTNVTDIFIGLVNF